MLSFIILIVLIPMILLNITLFKLLGKFKRIHPIFNFYITGLLVAFISYLLLWVLPNAGIYNDLFKNMEEGYKEGVGLFLYFFGTIFQIFYVVAIHFILLVCILVKLIKKTFSPSEKI